ncbi:Transposable element Tc3 transposase, partial [Fragariocoptes setiger]
FEALVSDCQSVTAAKIMNECSITNASQRTRLFRKLSCHQNIEKIESRLSAGGYNRTVLGTKHLSRMKSDSTWTDQIHEALGCMKTSQLFETGVNKAVETCKFGTSLCLHHSYDYIAFLREFVKSLLDNLNDGDCVFQQDNATIHVSSKTKEWINQVGIATMDWPARGPDLNIIENVWSLISSIVYDRRQYANKQELVVLRKKGQSVSGQDLFFLDPRDETSTMAPVSSAGRFRFRFHRKWPISRAPLG